MRDNKKLILRIYRSIQISKRCSSTYNGYKFKNRRKNVIHQFQRKIGIIVVVGCLQRHTQDVEMETVNVCSGFSTPLKEQHYLIKDYIRAYDGDGMELRWLTASIFFVEAH